MSIVRLSILKFDSLFEVSKSHQRPLAKLCWRLYLRKYFFAKRVVDR